MLDDLIVLRCCGLLLSNFRPALALYGCFSLFVDSIMSLAVTEDFQAGCLHSLLVLRYLAKVAAYRVYLRRSAPVVWDEGHRERVEALC
jgi:hypothetical protein